MYVKVMTGTTSPFLTKKVGRLKAIKAFDKQNLDDKQLKSCKKCDLDEKGTSS